MAWPLSQDYNEAIQSPQTSFSDPELRGGQAAVNALGMPMPCSGNFADVYRVFCPASQRAYAVKCFTRQIPGLRERYQQISQHLEQVKLPFMVGFTFLEKGIQIRGDWYPILKMESAEGMPLNQLVKNHLDKPQVLDKLCQMWVKLAGRLREANLAHCDLQHGNVLLVPGSKTGSLGMKLVDYDGMFVPALTQLKSQELGHPAYQHPQRLREGIYNLDVDKFSHLTIFTALRCVVAGGRELWDRYDNGDNLLFCHDDFKNPQNSPLFKELLEAQNPEVRRLSEVLRKAAEQPLDQTPPLAEVLGDERPPIAAAPPKPVKTQTVAVSPKPMRLAAKPELAPATVSVPANATLPNAKTAPVWRQRPVVWAALGCLGGAVMAGAAALIAVMLLLPASNSTQVANNDATSGPDTKKPSASSVPDGRDSAGKIPVASTSTGNATPPFQKSGPGPVADKKPAKTNKTKIPPPVIDAEPLPGKTPPLIVNEAGWVDLLKLTDPHIHAVAGQWHVDGSALVSDGNILSRLQVPFAPGPEYLLCVTVEPDAPNGEFYVGLALPGRQVSVAFSEKKWASGLERLSGKEFSVNESTRKGAPFTPNKPNEIVCAVGAGTIKVDVDAQSVIDWQGAFTSLTPSVSQWLPNPKALSLGSRYAGVRITKLAIKPIVGEGKILPGTPSEGADIALKKKILPGAGILAGTEWINSNNDTLAWGWTGRLFYNGTFKTFQTIDEKTIKISTDAKSKIYDTLIFDNELKSFEQFKTDSQKPETRYTGKRLVAGEWFDLRIVGDITGKHKLHISPTEMSWEIVAGKPPTEVKLNRIAWNLAKEPLKHHADLALLLGKTVDLKRVKLDKIKGTGTATIQMEGNAVTVVIDAPAKPPDPQKLADALELSLSFRVGDKKPDPAKVISHFRHFQTTVDLAVSPDGRQAAITSADGYFRVWELGSPKAAVNVQGHAPLTNTVSFIDNGAKVVFAGRDGFMRIVEVKDNPKIGKVDMKGRLVNALQAFPGTQQVLYATGDMKIGVVDLQSGKGSDMVTLPTQLNNRAWVLAFADNGQRVLTTGDDDRVGVWDLAAKKELTLLQTPKPEAGALSADGRLAATSVRGGAVIKFWDAITGKLLRGTASMSGATDVRYLAFSPDGTRLLSIHAGGVLRVWNVADCREIGKIGSSSVTVARFLPDGRHVIVGDQDGVIRVWNLLD